MGLSANQLLALVVVGMAVLILVTAEWMFRINRRKSVFSLVLGVLYLLAAGYYAFLAFASGCSPSPVDAGPMACAPVRSPAGKVIAAVSVSGPIERLTRQPGRLHAPAVMAAAERLSEVLRRSGDS